jgi:hypothetical protein
MPMRKEIDGNKNDIRVICSSSTDSPDAGYVTGVPIDPPDDAPGWLLVDLWVEHDTEQQSVKADKERGEAGRVVTRLVNPAFYQLWVRPKSVKKKRRQRATASAKVEQVDEKSTNQRTPPGGFPKKKRGRQKRITGEATAPNGGSDDGKAPGESVRVDSPITLQKFLACCVHTQEMLVATVNRGDDRAITLEDVGAYEPLCYTCKKAREVDTALNLISEKT